MLKSSNCLYVNLRVENLLKLCRTLKNLHQFHAHFITSGRISNDFRQNSVFANILFAITSIVPSPTETPTLSRSTSASNVIVSYATSVFRYIKNPSTFCFNTIIRIYTLHDPSLSSQLFFVEMRRRSVPPDFHTFPFVFKACAKKNTSLMLVKALHCQALRFGLLSDLFTLNTLIRVYSSIAQIDYALQLFDEFPQRDVVTYNVLIDGLVKSHEIVRARKLFDSMQFRDLVSWNSLIAGYAHMNQCREAINLFNRMIALGLKPDNVTIISTLSACTHSGDLEKGKAIHDYIKRNRLFIDSFLATGLVDFYAKCGFIDTAMEIFDLCLDKTLFTWNAMITGLAMHGNGRLTVDYFRKMVGSGIKPDGVSFISVLVGCSHSGLVDAARKLFNEMGSLYDVKRDTKHYGCMADLLGRAGLLEEAAEIIEQMPKDGANRENFLAWSGLLGGCRIHGNIEVAEKAAKRVKALKPEDGGVYKVMVEMYANVERWEDVVKVRQVIERDKKVKKNTAFSKVLS